MIDSLIIVVRGLNTKIADAANRRSLRRKNMSGDMRPPVARNNVLLSVIVRGVNPQPFKIFQEFQYFIDIPGMPHYQNTDKERVQYHGGGSVNKWGKSHIAKEVHTKQECQPRADYETIRTG